jgi:transcription termination/antitermination protein NusA
VHVLADAEQLSLAIGKRGQNVRLTAKLLNIKIDIQKDETEVSFEEKRAIAVDNMAKINGMSREQAEKLVEAGFLSVEQILAAEVGDIAEGTGFDEATAKALYEAAAAVQPDVDEETLAGKKRK